MSTVITRFPPSPTGLFHIGSARTALFNYLFAAHQKGVMHFRFEDTDRERIKKEYENDILDGLAWLGIPIGDSEIVRQSERGDIYRKHIKSLLEKGHAYEAEEGKDDPSQKVIRFKNPNASITFKDHVRGDVTFDTSELKDFVIGRSIDEPLYHLAVVIDDHEMGVTHVIRGEDHISNTPRQILILEALGFTRPEYAHIPLILAPDRTKLSKRHGATSLAEYRAMGFLPSAIVNYLALLGWNPGNDRELYTLEELIREFSIEKVHKGGAIFDLEKLKWFNRAHMDRMSQSTFTDYILPELDRALKQRGIEIDTSIFEKLLPIIRERIATINDLRELIEAGEFDYYFKLPQLDPRKIPQKATSSEEAREHLGRVHELLATLEMKEYADHARLKNVIWPYASEKGRGSVLWPLRYALSGKEKSPDPFVILSVLGKEESLSRIKTAQSKLSA
ncbi:glutamate--tRNA ligase [Candidatus Kaiserbacteria bacterium]|nr:glutamate--tRNA ligase [Candidatus Kaiserbacteria bacterium]